MRRVVLILVPALGLLAACGPLGSSDTSASTDANQPTINLPTIPPPAQTASCSFLKSTTVEDANGQHVGSVKINESDPSDRVCYFYRPDGGLQMTVRVYSGTTDVAQGLVNKAAPTSSASPASEPTGWSGGYQSTSSGAVYAVSKGGEAVIVTTNQAQTIKARVITEDTVTNLGL
ncbi:MAG TPA: DUF2020 domain-containing protein [Pseudonocardiaceae bacterium]